jgi:hypothetical protein
MPGLLFFRSLTGIFYSKGVLAADLKNPLLFK